MTLARVIGNVVCTIKDPSFKGRKILVCQPLGPDLKPQGATFLAFDEARAGAGDHVMVLREGGGCRQIWGDEQAPVNAVIAGVVDLVSRS